MPDSSFHSSADLKSVVSVTTEYDQSVNDWTTTDIQLPERRTRALAGINVKRQVVPWADNATTVEVGEHEVGALVWAIPVEQAYLVVCESDDTMVPRSRRNLSGRKAL